MKRLLPLFALALVAAAVLVSEASAGGIRDWEPCPDNGTDLTCPDGTVGVPYSIKFRAVEEPPCRPGEDTWHIVLDAAPPGLTLAQDGTLSGTPTESGTWGFWVEMRLPSTDWCNGSVDTTQERFVLSIKPGVPPVPKLTIGPEQSSVKTGTVGAQYSLPMTANLSDPKTWAIVDGTLPTGLTIGETTGVISGTPTAPGTFPFTVKASIDAARTDTKSLTIVVRAPLTITADDDEPLSEVGVRFEMSLTPSGGTAIYTWSTIGELPPGLAFANGSITGRPRLAGTFSYTVTLRDSEGRTTNHPVDLVVAPRLTIPKQRLKTGTVGKLFRTKLKTLGGVGEPLWRVKRGPLPKGIRFDRTTGSFYGRPAKAGKWLVLVEIVDELGVKSTATVTLVVKPALFKKKK
jgi:hypothetical protein